LGKGNWTRIPFTLSSLLNIWTKDNTSSVVEVAGNLLTIERKPASLQAFSFIFTYTLLAGSSPTRITAIPGALLYFPCKGMLFL